MEAFLTKLDALLQYNLPPRIQEVTNEVLIWIGLAFVVGMITRLIVWGGQWRRGAFTVFLVGMTGCCIGPLGLHAWRNIENFNPISPAGLAISVVASIIALFIYQFCSLFWSKKNKGE
ncbi:MAG: hypothetical protein J6S40_08000 [Thermoguttaceae bacterium]|nr:hypothetical protein [Thermoguttaceae bacterium]